VIFPLSAAGARITRRYNAESGCIGVVKAIGSAGGLLMTALEYAKLTITRDILAPTAGRHVQALTERDQAQVAAAPIAADLYACCH
jgi:hypothetical protein